MNPNIPQGWAKQTMPYVESEWVDKKKFVYKVFYRGILKIVTSDRTVANNAYEEILAKVS